MKVYVVDNGGQWTHREWRVLKYLGADAVIVPNDTPFEKMGDADAIVLSGGSPRIGLQNRLGRCDEYLDMANCPILGICAGHQFIARHFGGSAEPAKIPEYGKIEIEILEEDILFRKLPKRMIVWESHNDEVVKLPRDFILLASSTTCKIQAMKHRKKPIFGLQFHPEVEHTEYGMEIFENFLEEAR